MQWKPIIHNLFEPTVEYLFPALCAHCRERKRSDAFLCDICRKEMLSFPMSIHIDDSVFSLFRMNPVVRSLIHILKYQGAQGAAPYLISLVSDTIFPWEPSPIWIPVPLHPARFRERGYNQAERIADAARRRWGGRVLSGVLRRSRYSGSQTRLEAEARRWNAAGNFVARPPVPDSVVLVDDVYTTGSTTQSCEDALTRAGVKTCRVMTLAYEPKLSGRDDWLLDRAKGI